jgi:3-oxoacyl-[acyl-carrier protein] reductase
VTGGTRGLGLAFARGLLETGAHVVITGRDAGEATRRAAELGPRASAVALELTRPESIAAAFAQIVERHGRIDALVTNAGISGPYAPVATYPLAAVREVMEVNLVSTFACVQAVLPTMLARDFGRIVMMASIAGKEGNPNMGAYSAAKAAVIALTKTLGKELATTGVRVNCVAPGVFETEILEEMPPAQRELLVGKIPMGRVGQPHEAAAMVTWLCSDACSFSTGATFDLSGGRATY